MKITKDMNIMDVVKLYPQSASVFRAMGMGCVGCLAASNETIEQGANGHGVDVDMLIVQLNQAV